MATSSPSLSFLLVFPLFLLLTCTYSTSTPFSSPVVASDQLTFWSKNVLNKMPNAILTKLSPLSMHDSDYFTSLFSKQSFSSDAKFCSLANLACAANLDIIQAIRNTYNQNTYSNPSSHIGNDDPFSFFRLSILKQGKRVQLSDLRDTCPSRAFLPSSMASKISLTSNDLKRVFPASFVSPITKEAIEMTLQNCNAPTLKGETKTCSKSLEETIQFSKNALGKEHLLALTSKSTKGSGKELIIGSIKQYNADKMVSCHEVFLPFATYFCHSISSSRLYAVDLLEADKTRGVVNTVLAVCHMDTSAWPADHVAFKILNLSPGEGEACHWFSQIDLAWIGA